MHLQILMPKSPWDKQAVVGQKVRGTKNPWNKKSLGQKSMEKSPWVKKSMGQKVHGTKNPWDKKSLEKSP